MIRNKKRKGGGVGATRHTRQGRAIRGREMVAALGLDEKKTRIEHKVTSNN